MITNTIYYSLRYRDAERIGVEEFVNLPESLGIF
jgi:hypothetical protein